MPDVEKRVAERTVDGVKKWCVVHGSPQKPGSSTDKPEGAIIKCFPHTPEGKEQALAMHRAILANQASKGQLKALLRTAQVEKLVSGDATPYLFPQKYKHHLDEPVYAGDDGKAHGVITLGEPLAIRPDQLDATADWHGLEWASVQKRWSNVHQFWLYPVTVIEKWDAPVEYVEPERATSWVENPVLRRKTEETPSQSAPEMAQAALEDDDGHGVGWACEIIKRVDERRLVTAVVLKPGITDAQGDKIRDPTVIENAAHAYMIKLVMGKARTGFMHKDFSREIYVVESYIAPSPLVINGQNVPEGAWVMTAKVFDNEVWDAVKAGLIRGFSIGGKARVRRAASP
jgi:hypothetical protein